jgi:phage terminase large subunit GpA-like protein
MPTIIGTGTRTAKRNLGSVTVPCPQCGSSTAHALESHRMWITLLYVGVVPLRYTYFTTCSKCRKLAIVEKDQVDELKKLATQA